MSIEITNVPALPVQHRPGAVAELSLPSDVDGRDWLARRRSAIRAAVTEHGALLLRGIGRTDPAGVGAVAEVLTDAPFIEREAIASRTVYGNGVYSSSTWSADMPMCMHHEGSYAQRFPGLMLFGCLALGETGGTIELADARAMAAALPVDLVGDFVRNGWRLARNYHPETGSPWQEAFGTDDPAEVERYCADNAINYQWRADRVLRTWQRRPAVLPAPGTGTSCWFNQIAFLNQWTMNEDIRDYLLAEYGVDGLPFNTYHADGAPLSARVVDEINATYTRHAVPVRWAAGDLLLVDNVTTAHSRQPYTGAREVVVAMGDPIDRATLDPAWQRAVS